MTVLFFFSIAILLYAYAGYPLFLWCAARVRPKSVSKADATPSVSILISAFNEENHIGAAVENKLEQDYPAGRMEVLVVSDGSTDKTVEIVKTFAGRGVRLIDRKTRQGKTAALNTAAREATGEVLVFSDANSIYAPDALRKLVRNFADRSVGYVTGKMTYVDESGSAVGSGCTAYMKYENILRTLETQFGSVIGVDGGIDAVRKDLYVPMRDDLLPDFVLPLDVIRRGCRVVYEPEALLKEKALSERGDEWKMRVRVALRSFHAIRHMKALLNPFRFPAAAFQLISHKLLRYGAGLFQILAFLSNAALAGSSLIWMSLFAGQAAFYLAAVLGVRYVSYFCLLNAASLVAFVRFLKGDRVVTWVPRKGEA